MFISNDEVADLKSKADQVPKLQSQIERLESQVCLDDEPYIFMGGLRIRNPFRNRRTLKQIMDSIESRLDLQEKMQKMLFTHLGIEYVKITEETKSGKREKEVLRKIKKQSK